MIYDPPEHKAVIVGQSWISAGATLARGQERAEKNSSRAKAEKLVEPRRVSVGERYHDDTGFLSLTDWGRLVFAMFKDVLDVVEKMLSVIAIALGLKQMRRRDDEQCEEGSKKPSALEPHLPPEKEVP